MQRHVIQAGLLLLLAGCAPPSQQDRMRTTVESLGINYVPPHVPDDVPVRFKPRPRTKLAASLKPGETHLNLRALYRRSHRSGWDAAVYEWTEWKRFHLETKEDVYGHHANISLGHDAFWLGYSQARSKIEESVGTPD